MSSNHQLAVMKKSRIVSLIGTILIVPWACVLGFVWYWQTAWTYHHGWLNRGLLWFGVLLMAPAVLLSWFRPRLAAYWIFFNIAIAASLSVAHEWYNLVDPALNRIGQVLDLIVYGILYWFVPFAVAVCLLVALRSEAKGRSRKATSTA